MEGFRTYRFSEDKKAERARRLFEHFAAPAKAADWDFLVYVAQDQILTLRQLLHAKGYKTPADFRNKLPFKERLRQNMAREFIAITLNGEKVPDFLEVPLPFLKVLVDRAILGAPRKEKAQLYDKLGRYMLHQDTMTFLSVESKNALNP